MASGTGERPFVAEPYEVYSCYAYRATNSTTISVQLRKDCVTNGTNYAVTAPLYLIDFNTSEPVVDEYYLLISNSYPSRFSRITNNNSSSSISSLAFDTTTGILTITLSGTRRYMAADVRIKRQQF